MVSKSTPLIYLAKAGKLGLLWTLFKEINIPWQVSQEVVARGKEEGHSEALVVEEAVEKGWIKVHRIRGDRRLLIFAPELDKGEVETITFARKIKAHLI